MKKIIIGLFFVLLIISGCKKNCWRCTAITQYKYLYIKGVDTVLVYYIEEARPYNHDSLVDLGYFPTWAGPDATVEIPIDYSFCNEGSDFKPYKKCYRVK